MKPRIKEIQATLKRMSEPGYYGCWCAGYLKKALETELASLLKQQKKKSSRRA